MEGDLPVREDAGTEGERDVRLKEWPNYNAVLGDEATHSEVILIPDEFVARAGRRNALAKDDRPRGEAPPHDLDQRGVLGKRLPVDESDVLGAEPAEVVFDVRLRVELLEPIGRSPR